jgi:hypothetical protein
MAKVDSSYIKELGFIREMFGKEDDSASIP